MSETIFQLVDLVRQNTLKFAESLDPSLLDTVPPGFNNSIRWNLGHILLVQENLTIGLAGLPSGLPESYREFFGNGTKPADWTDTPPSPETLLAQLKEQPARLRAVLAGRLGQQTVKPFHGLERVGDLISFSLYHEGMHQGAVKALQKAASTARDRS